MKVYPLLLLLITLIACSESEPDPIDQSMKGEFRLVKAVGLEPMDVGGPNLDDPIIIRYTPHTYEYPEYTGSLILGDEDFELYIELPIATLHFVGSFEVVPAQIIPYTHPYSIEVQYKEPNRDRGGFMPIDYEWCRNTLKLKNVVQSGVGLYWDLYWERIPVEE